MSVELISARSRELLGDLRNLLLDQHKRLLDREGLAYEKTNGPVASPGALLALVLDDAHFAWLKQISNLVVEIDEALAPRSKAGQSEADALESEAREIMGSSKAATDFQVRYNQAIQENPEMLDLHSRIRELLETK